MQINNLSTNHLHLWNAYEHILRLTCSFLPLNRSVLFATDDASLRSVHKDPCDDVKLDIIFDEEIIGTLLQKQGSVLSPFDKDLSIQKLFDPLKKLGGENLLFTPLFFNEKLQGGWLIVGNEEKKFNELDKKIFQLLADNFNLRIAKELLTAENFRYVCEAKALYEISMEISQHLDLDRVLETVVAKTCSLLQADISYIALADEKDRVIRVRVTHGARGEELIKVSHKYGEGVGGWVAENRAPLIVDNYYRDVNPQPPGIPEILATEGIVSAICVPMCTHRGLVGVLYATSRREAAFNRSHLQLLQALGNQAAIAIENATLYAEQKLAVEKLRTSIATHERLLGLLLGNGGIQAITDTLSELVQCPILVENDQCQMLCWSSKGYQENNPEKIRDWQKSYKEFRRNFQAKDLLMMVRDTKRSLRLSPPPDSVEGYTIIVTPIVRGNMLLGCISAIEVETQLYEQQRAAIEEASIIYALELTKQETARANLLQHVITAQEEERKRIARELHDETSQALTALIVGLDSVSLDLVDSPEKAVERLRMTQAIAEGMLENIHRLISDLRPSLLDDLGLLSAIMWYSDQRLRPLGIGLNLDSNLHNQRLSPTMEIALYRIVQEAFTNIIRHAHATQVTVSLHIKNGLLELQIEDNGQGFDTQILNSNDDSMNSMGLLGIQERVSILKGEFSIRSAPGKGTTIFVRVPIKNNL